MRNYIKLFAFLSLFCVLVCSATGCNTADEHPNDPTVHTSTTSTIVTTTITTTTTTTTTTTSTTVTTLPKTTTIPRQTTTTTRPTPPITTTVRDYNGAHIIDAPLISQRPDYPSGCESVGAVMLLNYWGENISVDTFIDEYLPKSTDFYYKNGVYYGPSPYEYFIGNPRTEQAYGCMAPVIQRAIDTYYSENVHTINATGHSLQELCQQYIDNGQPVLVWVTIGMVETYLGSSWHLADGSLFSWPVNEHCMMLVGYDENYYYFNDPYTGKLKKYAHWICEDRYNALGKQALTIAK